MMKFKFAGNGPADLRAWCDSNRRLADALEELVSVRIPEAEVEQYLMDMIRALRPAKSENCAGMLFLMYEDPSCMPADARVEFVYTPTYLAAAILMTAMNRYADIAGKAEIREAVRAVLDAAPCRNFRGAGYDGDTGFLDTMEIFGKGDTKAFLEKYPEISSRFREKMTEALEFLEKDICTGVVKDPWSGRDYSARGKQVWELYWKEKDIPGEPEYVWYACYGSNVNRERFMRYIKRCRDTTPPVADRPFVFRHNIYFAKSSATWDHGGKAFLDDTCPGKAYGRIYKITAEQYEDVKRMEGSDYTKLLELGTVAGLPVYSFTDTQKNEPVRMPSVRYYTTILEGLKECYEGILEEAEPGSYLNSRILPEPMFTVARVIKRKRRGEILTGGGIGERAGMEPDRVTEAVAWLVEHQLIRQDGRSIRQGHSLRDPGAYFYTNEGFCARKLLAEMIRGSE